MFKAFVYLYLTIPIICFGSCWVDVYTDKKTDIYLDYCSIVQVGKYKKAWVRWVFAENKETSISPTKEYDAKYLTYFDCALRASTNVQYIFYSPEPDNKVVDSYNIEFKSTNLVDDAPDTLGEAVLNSVCRVRGRKK